MRSGILAGRAAAKREGEECEREPDLYPAHQGDPLFTLSTFKNCRTMSATLVDGHGRDATRSHALWLPDLCMAKVERSRGKLIQSMGATHDGCAHLYPEEMLFLAEVRAARAQRAAAPARCLSTHLAFAYRRSAVNCQ